MTDNERFIHDVGIANATDGQSLCRIPVAGGEEQPAADSRGSGVAAFRHDDDAAARPGGELHGVGRGAALGHAGRHSGEAQTGTVIVLNGDGQRAADIVVAATAGGMADGDALIILVAIVDAADGDALCRVPVAGGKRQRGRADGGGCGIAAGGGDGDAGGRFAVEDNGVGLAAGLSHGERGGREAQAGGVVVEDGDGDGVGTADGDTGVWYPSDQGESDGAVGLINVVIAGHKSSRDSFTSWSKVSKYLISACVDAEVTTARRNVTERSKASSWCWSTERKVEVYRLAFGDGEVCSGKVYLLCRHAAAGEA